MKLDLASAYAASLARVASWAVIAGIIYRVEGATAFAAFSLLRAVLTAVSLTGLGLAPALIILLPQFRARYAETLHPHAPTGSVIDYAPRLPSKPVPLPDSVLLSTAYRLLAIAAIGAFVFTAVIRDKIPAADALSPFWRIVVNAAPVALLAALARTAGDISGVRLQTSGRLALDNWLQVTGELIWIAVASLAIRGKQYDNSSEAAINMLAASIITISALRFLLSRGMQAISGNGLQYSHLLWKTGSVLMLAQLADLFYGPMNQAMIKGLLTTDALATYAPLLHIDAALLLGVGGLATLLLPKTAIAMGEKNPAAIRRYYVNGTLASLILLAAGASFAWAVAPRLFRVWFGDPMPATVALLPLVMIHTVIGGTAGVGRSILFGMNRAAAYTVASLIGGVANVGLAILLVTQTSLGLRGIILATILTVAVRCGLWMPWYTLRCIRRESAKLHDLPSALAADAALP